MTGTKKRRIRRKRQGAKLIRYTSWHKLPIAPERASMLRPLKGLIRPLKGLIRPLKGLIRPFKGLIRSLKGLIRPLKGLALMEPLWSP